MIPLKSKFNATWKVKKCAHIWISVFCISTKEDLVRSKVWKGDICWLWLIYPSLFSLCKELSKNKIVIYPTSNNYGGLQLPIGFSANVRILWGFSITDNGALWPQKSVFDTTPGCQYGQLMNDDRQTHNSLPSINTNYHYLIPLLS